MKVFGGDSARKVAEALNAPHSDEAASAAVSELFSEDHTDTFAKYVVDVDIRYVRSKEVIASLAVWHKSKEGFGVSDSAMLWCPTTGCLGIFEVPSVATELLFCQRCMAAIKATDLCRKSGYRGTPQLVANAIAAAWDLLQSDADVHMRLHPRAAYAEAKAALEVKHDGVKNYSKLIEKAREDVRHVYYRRSNILRDVSAGRSASDTIRSFIEA